MDRWSVPERAGRGDARNAGRSDRGLWHGLRPTTPAVDGLVLSSPANLAALPAITIGGASAAVTFAGGAPRASTKSTSRFPPFPQDRRALWIFLSTPLLERASTAAALLINVHAGELKLFI